MFRSILSDPSGKTLIYDKQGILRDVETSSEAMKDAKRINEITKQLSAK